jgi:hypothetical protein
MSYKRKIMLLECYEEEECEFFISMNTDKSEFEQKIIKSYHFIYNMNKNNFILSPPNYINLFPFEFLRPNYEIHIEKLAGDISLITNKKYLNHNNNYIFSLESNDKILDLKIEANKNSIFSIKYCYIFSEYNENISYNKYIVPKSGNYLFNFNYGKEKKITLDFSYGLFSGIFYTIFYPINCKIEIEFENQVSKHKLIKYISPDNTILFQDISEYGYYDIYLLDNENDNKCMVYVSSYSIGNIFSNSSENSIILEENEPKIFLLNEKYTQLNYSYYFGEINSNDIEIKIYLLNKGNISLSLFINKIAINKNYNITTNQIIKINNEDWKNLCINGQICKLSFMVKKLDDDIKNDLFIKICINALKDEDSQYKKNIENKEGINEKKNNSYIFYGIIIIILIGVIYAFYYYKKIFVLN